MEYTDGEPGKKAVRVTLRVTAEHAEVFHRRQRRNTAVKGLTVLPTEISDLKGGRVLNYEMDERQRRDDER
jgi:hypothetical protein